MANKFLITFLIIFIYKFLKNSYNLYRIKKIQFYFLTIFTDKVDNRVYETKDEAINLFKNAGIEDSFFPISQPIGFGQVANSNTSTFTNYPSNLNIFVAAELKMFNRAIGIYKKRIKECFNPFYWIDTVLFLPKTIFQYIGIRPGSIFVKISNLIYWLFTFFISLFKEDLSTFILSYLPENFFNFK